MPKYQIDTEDGHTYEIETEDTAVGPDPAKPPTTQMHTMASGEILPAVRSFASGVGRGIASLPHSLMSMVPSLETYTPTGDPWSYQPPDPQAGLKHAISEFRSNPAGFLGQQVPMAAMGADVDIPPVESGAAPTPTQSSRTNLPELGTMGKFASFIPGIGKFVKAYDLIRGMMPGEPETQAPEPFRPNPNIARQLNRGATGGTPPLAPLSGMPLQTGKVTGGVAPSTMPVEEPPPPQAPTPFQPNPKISRLLNRGASGGTPSLGRLSGRPLKTGKVTGGVAPAPPPTMSTPSTPINIQPISDIGRGFKPMGESPFVPPVQQELPLQEGRPPMQRIGMHNVVKFAHDNSLPFDVAKQHFLNQGYLPDWDVMGP